MLAVELKNGDTKKWGIEYIKEKGNLLGISFLD